ncbi:MAG TPA: cytochrome c [Burkholderiales bacterium]|nr:cytochrome c [Burkholderiales bacterium]
MRAALLAAGLALALPLAAQGDELGRKVFMELSQPPCHLCHTLKAAGAEGTVGPSLDELKPDLQKALQAVRDGSGVMPAYRDKLTPQQIEAVSRFVANTAGK